MRPEESKDKVPGIQPGTRPDLEPHPEQVSCGAESTPSHAQGPLSKVDSTFWL